MLDCVEDLSIPDAMKSGTSGTRASHSESKGKGPDSSVPGGNENAPRKENIPVRTDFSYDQNSDINQDYTRGTYVPRPLRKHKPREPSPQELLTNVYRKSTCYICYKIHYPSYCPYKDLIPRGAPYDPMYEVICRGGHMFNEEKWECTYCDSRSAMLKAKYCSICKSFGRHSSHECPEDKDLAARYQAILDKILQRPPAFQAHHHLTK